MNQNVIEEIEILRKNNLFRSLRRVEPGQSLLNFSSNDYLGLAQHPEIISAAQTALEDYGVGTGSSRLITGTTLRHQQLEQRLAEFKHTESALVFPTGYMANVGTISALVGQGDAVIVDKLNHASIIDGARLSGAKMLVYPHLSMELQMEEDNRSFGVKTQKHKNTRTQKLRNSKTLNNILEKYRAKFKRVLIITDSLFSMDGDIAPLPAIVDLAKHYDCLTMVDEAHATGVFGENGEGLIEHFGLSGQVDVVMGTLSKALGSLGGYVAGSGNLIDYLVNKSRSFIYTTALPVSCCAAALKAIEIIQREPKRRERLWKNVAYFCSRFKVQGSRLNVGSRMQNGKPPANSQIIPIHMDSAEAALQAADKLYKAGFLVSAIRPPTVPKGTSRLRISLSSEHREEDIKELINCLECV